MVPEPEELRLDIVFLAFAGRRSLVGGLSDKENAVWSVGDNIVSLL